jgi:hypothetical protein
VPDDREYPGAEELMSEPVHQHPTLIQLLEAHGFEGERLVQGVMEVNRCKRGEAIRQIRWAHGERTGCHRVVHADCDE